MRLQLISFAWRILNVPVADSAAANGVRDNSIRDLMERAVPAAPGPGSSPAQRLKPPWLRRKKVRKVKTSYRPQSVWLEDKALHWSGGSPPHAASMSRGLLRGGQGVHPQLGFLACFPPPCPGPQPARLEFLSCLRASWISQRGPAGCPKGVAAPKATLAEGLSKNQGPAGSRTGSRARTPPAPEEDPSSSLGARL